MLICYNRHIRYYLKVHNMENNLGPRSRKHQSKKPALKWSTRHTVLLALVAIILTIFLFRVSRYFKQDVISVNQAYLYQKSDLDSRKTASLPQGSRITILSSRYHWYYIKTDDGHLGWIPDWYFSTDKQITVTSLRDATIVLDAGHGGNDSGALSTGEAKEKTYTLIYIKELARKLQARGARVYLTRNKDEYISLAARPQLSNQVHADAFISIHFDSSPDANTASGVTTYYYSKKLSYSLAYSLSSQFSSLGLDNKGIDFGNFQVLRDNQRPAVLLEFGYINSDNDFAMIKSSKYRNAATNDIVKGLNNYFAAKADDESETK